MARCRMRSPGVAYATRGSSIGEVVFLDSLRGRICNGRGGGLFRTVGARRPSLVLVNKSVLITGGSMRCRRTLRFIDHLPRLYPICCTDKGRRREVGRSRRGCSLYCRRCHGGLRTRNIRFLRGRDYSVLLKGRRVRVDKLRLPLVIGEGFHGTSIATRRIHEYLKRGRAARGRGGRLRVARGFTSGDCRVLLTRGPSCVRTCGR